MTLQQLKYAVVTAEKGTVSEAAASLYIAQPSLTKALKELEKEMGISIFNRTNKGVFVSKEGEVFLGYARQVLEQAALITEKYTHQSGGKQEFCVSTQHYSFAVNAFVDLIQVYGSDNYDFSLRGLLWNHPWCLGILGQTFWNQTIGVVSKPLCLGFPWNTYGCTDYDCF